MIVAGTGHRPNKLGGYDPEIREKLYRFARRALFDRDVSCVISGMALGWDHALAVAALNLKIPLTCAVPFDGQESTWPEDAQARHRRVLELADEVVVVSPGPYSAEKMHIRNCWMVTKADYLLALWDGSAGGTGHCVSVAEARGKQVVNLWRQWNE